MLLITIGLAVGQSGSRPSSGVGDQVQQQAKQLNQEGMKLAGAGRYKEAAAAFEKAYFLDSTNQEFAFNYGLALQRLGQCGRAIAPLRKAAELPPDLPKAHLYLGNCYLDLGRVQEAVVQFEKTLVNDLNNVSALFELALAYHSLHDDRRANERLRWMKERNPNSPLTYLYAARALRINGQTLQAEKFIAEAIKMDPKSADAYFERGYIERLLVHLPEAEKSLLQAVRLSPEMLAPNLALGELYLDPLFHGDAGKAITYLKQAIQLSPGNPIAHLLLGRAYMKENDVPMAERELRSSIKLDPKLSRTHYLLATLLQRQGKKDEADQEFKAADERSREAANGQVDAMKERVKRAGPGPKPRNGTRK